MDKIVVGCLVAYCAAVIQAQGPTLRCADMTTCSACMEAGPDCAWCRETKGKGEGRISRCNTLKELEKVCKSEFIFSLPGGDVKTIQDDKLSHVESAESRAVQIKPQKVKLTLRPHETKKFNMVYRPARNYPLDLYYLMDQSVTMEDDIQKLVSLRDSLPPTIGSLTEYARIGFGSFANKVLLPFAMTTEKKLKNPCSESTNPSVCDPLYEYKHRLKITDQFSEFIDQVNRSWVTGHLDNVEGGLDALVQAVVCKERVGWRTDSRKIIIYASDGRMHFAGDGKLGGVVKPNDCITCHLDEEGFYSRAESVDYPSLAEVSRALADKKVFVIFTVTEDVKEEYNELHQLLQQYTTVGELRNDSSNILELVQKGYMQAVSKASFEDDSSSYLNIRYFSNCGSGAKIETSECSDVQVGKQYTFEVQATLEKCPENKKLWKNFMRIQEKLTDTSLEVELEYLCGCPCEDLAMVEQSCVGCNTHGDLTCGKCQCHTGWSGRECDCDLKNVSTAAALEHQCYPQTMGPESDEATGSDPEWLEVEEFYRLKPVSADGDDIDLAPRRKACSGNGDCLCGVCECITGYSGAYCQCKDCQRTLVDGELVECGGTSRGVCNCGKCGCKAGWMGDACDCNASPAACLTPGRGDECSGNGKCECGSCVCGLDSLGRSCRGRYCEICGSDGESNAICDLFSECARCYTESGERRDRGEICAQECSKHEVHESVPKIVDALPDNSTEKCAFQSDLSDKVCHHEYVYRTRPDSRMVDLHVTSECVGKLNTATVGIYVIIATLLLGLLIIMLVKMRQMLKDRLEAQKFEKANRENIDQMDKKELNPLYKSPISNYRMPAEAFNDHVSRVDSGQTAALQVEDTKPCEGCRISRLTSRSSTSSAKGNQTEIVELKQVEYNLLQA